MWFPDKPRFCPCLKTGPRLPTWYVLVCFIFNGLRWEEIVHFVDICGIVDHHCLNFLLLMVNLFLRSHWSKWLVRNLTCYILLWFSPPIQLTATDTTEILLKVALKNMDYPQQYFFSFWNSIWLQRLMLSDWLKFDNIFLEMTDVVEFWHGRNLPYMTLLITSVMY